MNVYFTQIDELGKGLHIDENGYNSDAMPLAMLPEKITIKAATKFQTYDIIDLGEVKVPRGEKLTSFSWSGILPGEMLRYRKDLIKTHYWMPPDNMIGCWSMWRANGTKIRLMVTGTSINHDVYLSDYQITAEGAGGSKKYDIEFVVAKDAKVYTVDEENRLPELNRPEETPPATYTVKDGDSLWSICQRFYGDATRCMDLYHKNAEAIALSNKGDMRTWYDWSTEEADDPYDMYLLHTGTVLTML